MENSFQGETGVFWKTALLFRLRVFLQSCSLGRNVWKTMTHGLDSPWAHQGHAPGLLSCPRKDQQPQRLYWG